MPTICKWTLLVVAPLAIFALTMLQVDVTPGGFGHGEKPWAAALRADRSWSAMSLSRLAQCMSTDLVVAAAAWAAIALRLVYRVNDEA